MENIPTSTPAAPQAGGTPTSSKRLWILIAIILVLVFGCMAVRRAPWAMSERMIERAIEQKTNGAADVDIKRGGNTTVTTDNGTMQFGNNSAPDNWPADIDLQGGIQITFSGSTNPQSG